MTPTQAEIAAAIEAIEGQRKSDFLTLSLKVRDTILTALAQQKPTSDLPEGFMYASSSELAQVLGKPKGEADTFERGLNAVMRREQMKIDNAAAQKPTEQQWRDISTHEGCSPVIVCRHVPITRDYYQATTAFLDVTGVWRLFRSEFGALELPFEPTHFMPLPESPK